MTYQPESPYKRDVLDLALDHWQPTNAGEIAHDFDEDPVHWLLVLRDSRDGEVMVQLWEVCRAEHDDADLDREEPAWQALAWVDLITGLVHQPYSAATVTVIYGIPEDAPPPQPLSGEVA